MSTRSISDSMPWHDAHDQIAFTSDALALAAADGDKEAGALAAHTDAALQEWEEIDLEKRRKRRALGKARVLVRRRDFQADSAMQSLHDDTLGEVKQNRHHPAYQRLFPVPVSRIKKLGLESQLPAMRETAHKLGESEIPAALRKTHTKRITDAISNGEVAVRTLEEAAAASSRTTARAAAWRDRANNALLGVEGALKKLAADRQLRREWVDTFFPDARSSRKSKPQPGARPIAAAATPIA
jgi:hypothetical protein